jgi:predicted transposase YbfD/YdcC
MIESERSFKNKSKETSKSIRFYISSLEENAEYFNTHVKNHWSIENNLHWQLDVVFSEDQQRIRKDNGAENFSTLRKMALQLIIQHKGKQSLKKARKRVAWNERFLIQILQSISCV